MTRLCRTDVYATLGLTLLQFPGQFRDIKPAYAPQEKSDEDLIKGCGSKDDRPFPIIGPGMDIPHDRTMISYTHVTYMTVLFIERLFFTVRCLTLVATQAILLLISLAEILLFV